MSRRTGIILALVSAVLLAVSVVSMTRRVRDYNARAEFPQYSIKNVTTRELDVFSRPVRILDSHLPGGSGGGGQAAITIEYGPTPITTPIKAPPAPDLPKLVGYAEWLAILDIKEFAPKTHVDELTQPVSRRVAIVKRNPAEGYDPDTWGSVRRADWTFDFFILTPEGTIQTERWRFPRGERGEKRLQAAAAAAAKVGGGGGGTPPDPSEAGLMNIKPLEERSWEYAAALFVIPALQVPKYKFKDDAVSAMGWTLPVGMFSALGLTCGVVFGAARNRPEPVQQTVAS